LKILNVVGARPNFMKMAPADRFVDWLEEAAKG
jgi:UDP-N-acetylglucosamine 2-epimerase